MSAILSADDLNDFISPGVACIKPIETLPAKNEQENAYEVTTEDQVAVESLPQAQISLTDCLACSGCVTSAEAVLISLQSHVEVLNTLDAYPELQVADLREGTQNIEDGRVFVASVSPQVRASLAATYGISERQAGYMIEQFLCGSQGLRAGGQHGSGFTWVIDTNVMRDVVLELSTNEITESLMDPKSATASQSSDFAIPRRPILSSACPGWICYAEKTHPHVLSHLSRLKSPQALTGTFIKTILSKNITPSKIWHLAIMPCFDKKLEASRQELTDTSWQTANVNTSIPSTADQPTRDVDCVITSRELLMLASSRNISLPNLPLIPLPPSSTPPFPDATIAPFLFPKHHFSNQSLSAGPSGGYLHHLLTTHQALHPNSAIHTQRGRNADVIEYTLISPESNQPILKAARYYGFRNIQNLVRKLKPPRTSKLPGGATSRPAALGRKVGSSPSPSSSAASAASEYAYIEVMACPGGCTNGGGQIRLEDAKQISATTNTTTTSSPASNPPQKPTPHEQRTWLARVDEAYYSADSDPGSSPSSTSTPDHDDETNKLIYDLSEPRSKSQFIHSVLQYWSDMTSIPLPKLVYTTFRKVESDVGKSKGGVGDTARVAELAGKIGGGW
ncbi:Cytosolic Fe-S cluster assembly factor nar1 [Emydomyces testavorans]|uniref:Cytosolic Fe-S cluster assembly factor NAR1 n=1 Tax=Emydomyces testavorans TaxID=2070801 RepID=A0AAF0DPT3_9EURO|nr:Cytosolic Fe-S cluster assembly factor nar1 [Emydomyces testavorans]